MNSIYKGKWDALRSLLEAYTIVDHAGSVNTEDLALDIELFLEKI